MIFKNIVDEEDSVQREVLSWRNDLQIRKNMYTDTLITLENHKKWLNSLKDNKNTIVYVAYENRLAIGIVSISNIDLNHKHADWAFYLNPNFLAKKGLGSLLEYHFLNYIFENYKIDKLNCEVLETNPSVITLHKKFGFTEEGIRRKNIIKDKQRIDVYLLGILKDEWYEIRNKFIKIIERLER